MKKLTPTILLFLLLFALVPRYSVAQTAVTERGVILIISSYNPDTRRMSSFISEFEDRIVMADIMYDIYVENLECRGVTDAPIWMEQVRSVLNRYQAKRPKAIVLLGQEAWATYVSLGNFFPDTQIFSCFASANGVMLPPPTDLEEGQSWQPQSIDLMKVADSISHQLAGGPLNNYDIRRNVELIKSLYPEVENLAFVSDNTYGGISLQSLVRKEMRKFFPQIKLHLIDSRAGDSCVIKSYAQLPPKSAVLLGTWRVGRDGEYLMQRSLNELVKHNSSIPVFSVTGSGIGDVAIGGFVPKYEAGAKEIADQIIYAQKHGAKGNTHKILTEGQYRFDASKLSDFKIPQYALPNGSLVEDAMADKLSKYSNYISLMSIALAMLVLLLTFIVWLFLRTSRLTKTLETREEELVIARENAEESDRLKSAFLANMSHEIRTPLNAIVGFSSLMGSNELSCEERAEYSSIVINNSEMLLTLLNDILDISSLECGKSRFVFTTENLVETCRHVMLTTAHTRASGVEGIFNPPCESFMLNTDAHRLSQILINLLTNASKFTTKGSITLGFEVNEQERMVYFSVTDTGEGIPLDKQEAVFNRFEKLYGNQKKGTGLGLAICRQTVNIFGGRIWVDSSYTEGARFVFSHPLDIEINIDDHEQPSSSKGPQI